MFNRLNAFVIFMGPFITARNALGLPCFRKLNYHHLKDDEFVVR